jgi:hypothetical protein
MANPNGQPSHYFKKGNQHSVGNRGNHYPRALKGEYIEGVTFAKVHKLLEDVYRRAIEEGDNQAARLWLGYVLGKPVAAVEVSGPGGGPLPWGLVLTVIRSVVTDEDSRLKLSEAFEKLADAQNQAVAALPGS